jgi:hypothetical protein
VEVNPVLPYDQRISIDISEHMFFAIKSKAPESSKEVILQLVVEILDKY